MIVDAHVHLYPPDVNRDPAGWAATHGEPHWAELCTRRRKDGRPVQTFPSVDQLLRDMDAAGVAKAILLGWYWENHASCVLQNRFYADCIRAHPDRLSAFATIHPAGNDEAIAEIRRAYEAGLIGLGELSPHSQGYGLNDASFRAVLTEAARFGMFVNLHVTDPQSKPYPGRVETPLNDFVRLAREFPGTNFILAHWGGGLAWSPAAVALSNLWFDTAASPLLYGAEVWTKAKTKQVFFGSDYPLILYPRTASVPGFEGALTEARVSGASPEMMGGNAMGLFVL